MFKIQFENSNSKNFTLKNLDIENIISQHKEIYRYIKNKTGCKSLEMHVFEDKIILINYEKEIEIDYAKQLYEAFCVKVKLLNCEKSQIKNKINQCKNNYYTHLSNVIKNNESEEKAIFQAILNDDFENCLKGWKELSLEDRVKEYESIDTVYIEIDNIDQYEKNIMLRRNKNNTEEKFLSNYDYVYSYWYSIEILELESLVFYNGDIHITAINSKKRKIKSLGAKKQDDLNKFFDVKSLIALDDVEKHIFYEPDEINSFIGNNIKQFFTNTLSYIVYNVGQGLCTGLINSKEEPIFYYDFGCGTRANYRTYSHDRTFSKKDGTFVILSHWDDDHYHLANEIENEHMQDIPWITPDAILGPRAYAFAGKLAAKNNLYIMCSQSKCYVITIIQYGDLLVQLFKIKGRNKSHHCNGIGIYINCNEKILSPGDNIYRIINTDIKEDLTYLIATHHGGTYNSAKQRNELIPLNKASGQIVYSYGIDLSTSEENTFGHPSYTEDYKLRNWNNELHTVHRGHEIKLVTSFYEETAREVAATLIDYKGN